MLRLVALAACVCCAVGAQAGSYVPGADNDPLMRSAAFESATHRPFQAAAHVMEALSMAAPEASSQLAKPALKASLDGLGLVGSQYRSWVSSLLARVDTSSEATHLVTTTDSDVFRRYNDAVVTLRQGENGEGLSRLEAIASADYSREEERLLRDKVNLALGYYFLDRYQFKTASGHFKQVRRLSPYGKRALIGLGWSLLSPEDQDQYANDRTADSAAQDYLWFGSDDDIANARRRTPFRHSWSIVSGEKKKDLLKALVPWMELINDDSLDPAVQEGMLTLPYAMVHLGDLNKAISYYQAATQRLNDVLAYLDAAIAKIKQGQLVGVIGKTDRLRQSGWDIWLCSLLEAPETDYLRLLVDDVAFLRALEEFRQLLELHDRLASRQQQFLNEAGSYPEAAGLSVRLDRFLPLLEQSLSDSRVQLEDAALQALRKRRQQAERYVAESGFALARIHENPRKELKRYIEGDWQ